MPLAQHVGELLPSPLSVKSVHCYVNRASALYVNEIHFKSDILKPEFKSPSGPPDLCPPAIMNESPSSATWQCPWRGPEK